MVQEEKVSNRRGFVYQGLSRMHKKTGLLLKRSGKYYASPKLLAEEFEAQTGTRATEVAPAA
jgi:hypothetical protein